MSNKILATIFSLVTIIVASSFIPTSTTPLIFDIPKNWPKPVYDFSKNPLTEEGFQLGRHLFYDPILSRDSTISCASCHLQATGFTHVDHRLSHGINGKIGTRNSMTIMNVAWNKTFMWDGAVNHLDVQPLAPMTSEVEMDEQLIHVVKKLNANPKYRSLFEKAFGDTVVTGQRTLLALSQFTLMLKSANSKYDKYIRNESGGEFTDQEKNGLALFRTNCASCHSEPLFTNGKFENNGIDPDDSLADNGRMKITHDKKDSLCFKVPTLRNIQFTQPYMHDGRFKKLLDVVNHYTDGIQVSPTLSTELKKPIQLTSNEKIDLVAFLLTLTDKEFLYNPRFSYPRE